MSSVFGHNSQQWIFCINAYVNVRNSISDFLDLKLCVQIPVIKNMSSVFGLENMGSIFGHNSQQWIFLH